MVDNRWDKQTKNPNWGRGGVEKFVYLRKLVQNEQLYTI